MTLPPAKRAVRRVAPSAALPAAPEGFSRDTSAEGPSLEVLAYLRRFEHFKGSKCLRLLRWTPEGRHYSGVGGAGALAVILGGGWAGSSSFSLFSKRLSSGSGSV